MDFPFNTRKSNLIAWLYGDYLSVALKRRGSGTLPKKMEENEEAVQGEMGIRTWDEIKHNGI